MDSDPKFDDRAIDKLCDADLFLKLQYAELRTRGVSRVDALKIVFNTFVLGDSVMVYQYEGIMRVLNPA